MAKDCKIIAFPPNDTEFGCFSAVYPGFFNDLTALFSKGGNHTDMMRKMHGKLRMLKALRKGCVQQRKVFERLRHVDVDFYSMKLKPKDINLRVIFVFGDVFESGLGMQGNDMLLLHAFYEDTKGPKGSYSKGIETARERLQAAIDSGGINHG